MAPNESKQFLQKDCVNTRIVDNNSSWILYLSAFSADLLWVFMGSIMVWPSSVLPKLMSNNTDVNPLGRPITTLEASCIVSSTPFSVIFGLLIASIPADIIGRKKTLLSYTTILFCSITTIAFARNTYIYYFCFCCVGITFAGIFINVVIYNTEIADDKNRAWLSCCVSLGLPVGQLYSFVLGASIQSVKIFFLLTTIPGIIHFLLYNFTVESPIYFIIKNDKTLAIESLKKLRNFDDFIDTEYKSMEEFFTTHGNKKAKFLNLLKTNKSRKAFFLSLLLIYTQQMSGINVLFAYLGLIFNEAGATLSGNEVGIIAGSVNLTTVLILIFIINKFGRRPLMLISSFSCSISLLSIAFYFFLKEKHSTFIDSIRWLPVLSIILFILSYGLGLGSIPMGYIGELFSNELRATGVSAAFMLAAVVSSVFDFGFPLLSESLGIYFCLFMFSSATFIGFVLLYICLPETRGKSFNEIQNMLDTKKTMIV
ncbi:facilitated trehalose transporter Tret1-like [Diorhabda sublineata]|uniref:facilitated trehalose transporter Tret1-like n=1 Tax=Diorhabda sublineata TaxID=1163346 RepID=UPI0024E114B9|nr:facilitated trehalose transporter Tret1-like [Diorhabda sublineata]